MSKEIIVRYIVTAIVDGVLNVETGVALPNGSVKGAALKVEVSG